MAKRTPPDELKPDGEPRKRSPRSPKAPQLRPVKERIGEGGGNLGRRGAWFRKRSADRD